MRKTIRRRIETSARVRDFSRAHPASSAAQTALLDQLGGLVSRAETLAIEERAGRLQELAAANRRQELRRAIQFELLPHLVRVGQLAGEVNPALAGKFYLRSGDATHTSFLVSTKRMLSLAEPHKELLVSLGLSDTLLDDLRLAVTQFEEALTAGREGQVAHVRARKELDQVAEQMAKKVEQLNRLNRYRFRKNPDLLAAWEMVRLVGPRVRSEPEASNGNGNGNGSAPPAGGIAPTQ